MKRRLLGFINACVAILCGFGSSIAYWQGNIGGAGWLLFMAIMNALFAIIMYKIGGE